MSLFTDECLELLEQIDRQATLDRRRAVLEYLRIKAAVLPPVREALWQLRDDEPPAKGSKQAANASYTRRKPPRR